MRKAARGYADPVEPAPAGLQVGEGGRTVSFEGPAPVTHSHQTGTARPSQTTGEAATVFRSIWMAAALIAAMETPDEIWFL